MIRFVAIKSVVLVLAPIWAKRKGKSQVWTLHFSTLWGKEPAVPGCHSAPAASRRAARDCLCPWSGLRSSP